MAIIRIYLMVQIIFCFKLFYGWFGVNLVFFPGLMFVFLALTQVSK